LPESSPTPQDLPPPLLFLFWCSYQLAPARVFSPQFSWPVLQGSETSPGRVFFELGFSERPTRLHAHVRPKLASSSALSVRSNAAVSQKVAPSSIPDRSPNNIVFFFPIHPFLPTFMDFFETKNAQLERTTHDFAFLPHHAKNTSALALLLRWLCPTCAQRRLPLFFPPTNVPPPPPLHYLDSAFFLDLLTFSFYYACFLHISYLKTVYVLFYASKTAVFAVPLSSFQFSQKISFP